MVGNRTQIVDPDARVTRYEYDERDQETRMTDPDGNGHTDQTTPTVSDGSNGPDAPFLRFVKAI